MVAMLCIARLFYPATAPALLGPHSLDTRSLQAIEDLDEALQRKLDEDNKRDSDLDPLLEALYGEEMLKMQRASGDAEFVRRETCVKWLHVGGNY